MLQKIKKEWYTDGVYNFIKERNADEWFAKTYGTSLDKWDFNVADEDVIRRYLHEKPELYMVVYDDCTDGFNIYEIDIS